MKKNQKWVGLTGGFAAGKGEAGKFFKSKGIPVIDLDEIGRELNKTKKVENFYKKLLGEKVLSSKGLDKSVIREALFKDEKMRKKAESFLHPLIWGSFLKKAKSPLLNHAPVIICESALLIENNFVDHFDEIILITASIKLRKERALKRDKISEELFKNILANQFSNKKKIPSATRIISNRSSKKDLYKRLLSIYQSWVNLI